MAIVGTVEYIARIDSTKLASDAKKVERTVGKVGDDSERAGNRGTKSFSTFAKVGLAGVASVAIAVGALLVSNIDNAIKRVDTLNNSNRTFANMGFNVKEVASAMDGLKKSILGLPTSLDSAVSGLQLIAGATGDIGKSQRIFSAINNGVIGFGGNAEQVSGAVRQLSQDLAGGVLTAETWNSLLDNGLGPALNAVAKQMGKTSKQLKMGLSDGSVSVQDFTNRLIIMNEKGGGGMASLETIARDATSGISTSFSNMNTAITRGIATIIEQIGSKEIAASVTSIGVVFESALKAVSEGVIIAKYAIDTFMDALKPVFEYIGGNKQVMEVLKLSLIAIAAIVGILIIAVGVALVAAFALVVAAIQVAIYVVDKIILGIMWLGDAIAGVIYNLYQFGVTVTRVFGRAYLDVKNFFSGINSFFANLFASITRLFGRVGIAIGDAIGNGFKSVINGILRFAVGKINSFIDSVNNAVDLINKIPGVDVSKMARLPVPQLASGGIVTSPTLAMIGEGRESEAVIPLSKLDAMLSNGGGGSGSNAKYEITINMAGIMAKSRNDLRAISKDIIESVNEELRAKQLPEIGGGAIRSTV